MYTKQDYARAAKNVAAIAESVSGDYIASLRELVELKADDKNNLPAFEFDKVEASEVESVLDRLAESDEPEDVSAEYAGGEVSCYTWDLKCAALAFSQWEDDAMIESKPSHMGWVDYIGQMSWYEAALQYAELVKKAAEDWIDENPEEENN